jgi:hypothetical protein
LKRKAKSGNQHNTFEVGAKIERAERELEGKLPPFSSFFWVIFLCGVVAVNKVSARSCCHPFFYV